MNSVLQRIAVYCSASDGVPEVYNTAAYRLGQLLAQEGVEVVYGDGGIGLMKHLAEGVLAEGGRITGVIPRFMVEQGWNNPRSTQTIVTASMHERKAASWLYFIKRRLRHRCRKCLEVSLDGWTKWWRSTLCNPCTAIGCSPWSTRPKRCSALSMLRLSGANTCASKPEPCNDR